MFCPNCGTQNPETAATCTKCGFALKAGGAAAAAPKFKGTMLMQGAPPAMQAVRDAAAAAAAAPGPMSQGAPAATGAAAPPSRLKGTIVGVAAPAAGAAPAPPTATGAGAPGGAPNFPGTLAFDAPPPQGFGAPDPMMGGAPPAQDQHQFGGGANPLGATFAIGQDAPPAPQFGGDMGGGAPPPAGGGYGAPADQGFGGAPPPAAGGYDPNAGGGYGGAPMGGPPPGGDGGFGAPQPNYGAPPGGPGGPPPQQGYGQPAGGFGADPMQQMNQGGMAMNPYGGGAPMAGPMGNPMGGMVPAGSKSWMTTLLLACFAGTLGVHRFYTGHTLFGVLQLVTCGGGGIWTLIDIIFIITGKYTDAQGRPLQK